MTASATTRGNGAGGFPLWALINWVRQGRLLVIRGGPERQTSSSHGTDTVHGVVIVINVVLAV